MGRFRARSSAGTTTSEAPTRFVFVLGTGRCGSTLIQEVLAGHAEAGFLSNLEDRSPVATRLSRWNNPIYRRLPVAATKKGRIRFAPSEGYRALHREVSPILVSPSRDLRAGDATPWLAARTRAFFERCAQRQGRRVFLHKFTGWPRAGFLRAALPDARFIHVIRDGRAVANSWLQMAWWQGFGGPERWQWGPLPEPYAREWNESSQSFPILAGILWKLLIDAFDDAVLSSRRDRWMEVHYEDVLARPREVFEQMLGFCGLDLNPQFDRMLAGRAFNADRAEAYRRDLDPTTVAMLSASLEKHLERHGYAL